MQARKLRSQSKEIDRGAGAFCFGFQGRKRRS
jgi:hypothetical protein